MVVWRGVVVPDADISRGIIATTPPTVGQVAPAAPGAPKKRASGADLKRHTTEDDFDEQEKDDGTEDGSLTGSPVKKQKLNKKKKVVLYFTFLRFTFLLQVL